MRLDLEISDALLEKLRAEAAARGQDLNDYVVAKLARSLALTHTALLVIDLQRGAFDGVRCPAVDSPERLFQNASTLIEAARAGGHVVVFIQHCEGEGAPFEKGTDHWRLHESLVPLPGESAVQKKAASAFKDTDLSALLDARGIRNLILCGLQSEYCVSSTAQAALELGYGVRIASDGHGTWPENGQTAAEIENEVNLRLASLGALMAATEDLSAALRLGHGPALSS